MRADIFVKNLYFPDSHDVVGYKGQKFRSCSPPSFMRFPVSRVGTMLRSLFLTCLILSVFIPSLSAPTQLASGQELVFEDRFEGALKPGWEWLHDNAPCRRFVNNSLEILTEPFLSGEARNALVRPINFLLGTNGYANAVYRIETECYFLEKPTARDQQCGIYWIQNNKVIFRLFFANDNGKMYVYPGKVPVETPGGRLRLNITGRFVVAEFCPLNEKTFRRLYEGKINWTSNDRISLQCWGGQKSGATDENSQEQWARFRYFRVEKLDE